METISGKKVLKYNLISASWYMIPKYVFEKLKRLKREYCVNDRETVSISDVKREYITIINKYFPELNDFVYKYYTIDEYDDLEECIKFYPDFIQSTIYKMWWMYSPMASD